MKFNLLEWIGFVVTSRPDTPLRLSQEGYSQRFWLNELQRVAKETALSKGELSKAVENSRRLVCLAQEAWGETQDIFEIEKMEFYELKERLKAIP